MGCAGVAWSVLRAEHMTTAQSGPQSALWMAQLVECGQQGSVAPTESGPFDLCDLKEMGMTTRWRPEFDPEHLYFVTTTAVNRSHIFQRDIVKRIVVDSLHCVCLMNNVALYNFVVMPNHVHVIIQCPTEFPPGDWARAFKAGASQLIVRLYQMERNARALEQLAAAVTWTERQAHKVWEDGYLAKDCVTPEFVIQKAEYTHNNPTQPHWALVERPQDYLWSSARFYLEDDRPCLIPLHDLRDLLG